MNTKLLCSLPVAMLFFVMPSPAEAMSFTTFDSRSAFENATGADRFETEDFNNVTATDFRNTSQTVGGLTLSDNSGFRARIATSPAAVPTLNIDGSPAALLSARAENGAAIAFSSPITAFGAAFAGVSNGGRDTRFVFNDGTDLAIPFRGVGGDLINDGFFGFVADSPFDSFRFRRFDGTLADGFSVDNVLFRTAQANAPQPVPSPALLPGIVGMGAAALRRRRRSQAAKPSSEEA